MDREVLRKFAQDCGGALQPVDAVQEQQRRAAPRGEHLQLGSEQVDGGQRAEVQFIQAGRFHRSPLTFAFDAARVLSGD